MGRIYTLANQKGGVGKTTTVINLGAYLARYGQRVLLVDLDPQSNATSSLKIDKNTVKGGTYNVMLNSSSPEDFILRNKRIKLSILPSSPSLVGSEVELVSALARESRLKNALSSVLDKYDYILVDCPPSLGLLTLNGLVAAKDGVIIPVQCEYLALEGLSQLIQTLERVREAISPALKIRGVLLTMFDARTNLSADVVQEVRRFFPNRVFKTIIPRTVRLAEAPSYGLPVSVYSPESSGALSYAAFTRELLEGDGRKIPNNQE
jgi:chromosome partitioning protein